MAKKKTYRRRRQKSWDEWYKLAKEYRRDHGDLLVPMSYVSPNGEKLGRWIGTQRAIYNDVPSNRRYLYPEQIQLLEQIGMVWKLEYRHPWKAWLKKLKWYKGIYGNIDIPGDFEDNHFHLGNWIIEQRKKRHAGLLTEQQIADLDNLGMLWNVSSRPRTWEEWYNDAVKYYEEQGDLQVPTKYQTPDGYWLGVWVYEQYRVRKGEVDKETLSQEQIDKLDAIHMIWDRKTVNRTSWNQMYEWVCEYQKENGKLPIWPLDLKAPDGRSMPGWIAVQRSILAKNEISDERKEKLKSIGIVAFKSQEDKANLKYASWDKMYEWVAEFFKLNGTLPKSIKSFGELILPQKYGVLTKADKRVVVDWIRQQKDLLSEGELSDENIQRLTSIGLAIPSSVVKKQAWESMYRWVVGYVAEHGKLPLSPNTLTASDGRNVPSWISNQRKAIEKGYILSERKERLEAIGVVPIKSRAVLEAEKWEEMYEWISRYIMVYGKSPVQGKPQREIKAELLNTRGEVEVLDDVGDPPGEKGYVAKWVRYQEICLANGKMSEERKERLALIGILPIGRKPHTDAWEEMYEWVVQYKKEFGKLPLSPKNLRSPDGRIVPEWIQYQRDALADGNLSEEQTEKLNLLGLKPTKRRPKNESWESMYRWLEDYVHQYGQLPGKSRTIRSDDGRCVPDWIRNQEKLIAEGKQTEDRIKRLEQLGISVKEQGD